MNFTNPDISILKNKEFFIFDMDGTIYLGSKVFPFAIDFIKNLRKNGKTVMCHVDAYRITDDDDLYSTGFYDCADYEHCIMAIEWSENIPFALPDDSIKITVEKLGENKRKITVNNFPYEL